MMTSAEQVWTKLDSERGNLLTRSERYAALTIPKIMLPEGFDKDATDQTHDYQSIGAQAVNHLTNKVMLGLFRPTQPFFRMDAGDSTKEQLQAIGLDESAIVKALGELERQAAKRLDKLAQRPKLYTAIRHLIITGNVLLCFEKEALRTMGLRYWAVKRMADGRVHTLVIREQVCFDELDKEVQAALPQRYQPDTVVNHYRWIQRNVDGDYTMSQWVDSQNLGPKFEGKWPEHRLPYRVIAWDLADEANYGTGLVEEYAGDLEALSVLSESVVDGACLGTEYRWMVNPTGQTTVDDLNNSRNGDALAGRVEDVAPTQGGNPAAIQVADAVLSRYERRVAMGFLMQNAVMRDAERVTAEEIRQVAQELETAYGGVYSQLANALQRPVADWLLEGVDNTIKDADLSVSVVTGLDALSRGGDLENLRLALNDLAVISTLPPELQGRIKFNTIADYVGNGRGIDLTPFLKTEDEYKQYVADQAALQVQQQTAMAAGEAAAQGTANQ